MVVLRFHNTLNDPAFMSVGTSQFRIDYDTKRIHYIDYDGVSRQAKFSQVIYCTVDMPVQFIDIIIF